MKKFLCLIFVCLYTICCLSAKDKKYTPVELKVSTARNMVVDKTISEQVRVLIKNAFSKKGLPLTEAHSSAEVLDLEITISHIQTGKYPVKKGWFGSKGFKTFLDFKWCIDDDPQNEDKQNVCSIDGVGITQMDSCDAVSGKLVDEIMNSSAFKEAMKPKTRYAFISSSKHVSQPDKDSRNKIDQVNIPIMSYKYEDKSKRGVVVADIKGKGFEARAWVVRNIGKICSEKNITMIAGQEPEKGGHYRVLNESVKEGKLTIEFEASF